MAPDPVKEAALVGGASLRIRELIGPEGAFWEEEVAVTRSSRNP